MSDLLQNLAGGLRAAAGVFNPAVQQHTMREDAATDMLHTRFAMEQATPQAIAAREKLAAEQRSNQFVIESARTYGIGTRDEDIAGFTGALMSNPLTMDKGLKYREMQEARLSRAEQARERIDVARQNAENYHEARMSRLANDQERTAEIARHNKVIEEIRQRDQSIRSALSSLRVPSNTKIADEKGNLWWADSRDPSKPLVPIMGPDGKQARGTQERPGIYTLADGRRLTHGQLVAQFKAESDAALLDTNKRKKFPTDFSEWAKQRHGIAISGGVSGDEPTPGAPAAGRPTGPVQARANLAGKAHVKINGQWYEE